MFQSYDIHTLHFVFDVNPYYYQKIYSAIDHKEGNEFSVVLFYYFVYSSVKFLLADAILTSY